jgi:hypothetical protein
VLVKTVRRLEFVHPGTIIEAAGFVQSRLLTLVCETHETLTYYQVPFGLPGRYHVVVETCCMAALARAAESLSIDADVPGSPLRELKRVGGAAK